MKVFLLILLLLSDDLLAFEKNHNLGTIYGTGSVNVELETEDDDIVIHKGLFYEYKLASDYSIYASIVDGEGDLCLITCGFDQRKVSWNSLQIAIKASVPMTQRWRVFGRIGGNYYDSKISGNFIYAQEPLADISKSGLNYVASLGLEFRAHNGFKFGFEAQHLPMDIIDANIYSVFAGFSF